MKILIVCHGYPPNNVGGTEVYASSLANELSLRHTVGVFFRYGDTKQREYTIASRRINSTETYGINNTFSQCRCFEDTYADSTIAEKFKQVFETFKPDIVHVQHLLYLSAEIIGIVRSAGVPVVFTLNDYWLLCPQGQFFNNRSGICVVTDLAACPACVPYQVFIRKNLSRLHSWMAVLPHCVSRPARNLYIWLRLGGGLRRPDLTAPFRSREAYMQRLMRSVNLFIAPSDSIREKFIGRGMDRNKIRMIGYGFDQDGFQKANAVCGQKLRFAFIGNLMPAKGVHLLIKAFCGLPRGVMEKAELRIYGGVFSFKGSFFNYKAELEAFAGHLGSIRFMGPFDHSRIGQILSEIDVLVVPSVWEENAPLVIQEAFMAGKPVIAARTGGIPESVKDQVNGLLYDPPDDKALARCMSYLIERPAEIERLRQGIPGVKTISEHAREMEKVYESLLLRQPAAAEARR